MLELTNVINVSVSQAPIGLAGYQINNLALFTSSPFLSNPNTDSFRVYKSPTQVGADFGTATEVYQQALAVFAQQPNILAGGGALIVLPINYGETLLAAITRTKDLVFYCGIISDTYPTGSDRKTLADGIQAMPDKMLALPSNVYADIAGVFTDIKTASDRQTRCMYYSVSALAARLFAAAAFGRGFSVNFAGSRTAITMNMKQLVGIVADPGVTQTYWNAAQTAGVDTYVSYAGVSSYVSNGANGYFDDIYNLIWFVNQIKVVGFNALAQVSTKIPQTENGMSLLKSAFRAICEQARSNGYIAEGQWNSSEWFGVQSDMNDNILARGYYIYSQPVNLQNTTDRANRVAPLVQIALKQAGAIHSASVLIQVNA